MKTSAPVPYSVSVLSCSIKHKVKHVLQEHGEIVEVGNTEVYVVGSGAKCVIWCHDMKGFNSGDRTRQLIDKLSELTGWVIVLPNFLGDKKIEDSADEYSWLSSITDWNTIRDFWVERLLPYLSGQGVKA